MLGSSSIISLLALASAAFAAPSGSIEKRAPTVYLAGDSTMATAKGGAGTLQGWGTYLPYSMSTTVVNKAIGGRSSRSYTVENRFSDLVNLVKANDIVIIEFGHNDGGSLKPTDNGRSVCPGAGTETCQSTYNGVATTVYTYPFYLIKAGQALIAKGAKVIISSPTPNNPWESGSFVYSGSRFVDYSKSVAATLGSNAFYVDHGAYAAAAWKALGKAKTDAYFVAGDHTHTLPIGADVVAKSFVKGLQCAGGSFLKPYVKNSTSTITGSCL